MARRFRVDFGRDEVDQLNKFVDLLATHAGGLVSLPCPRLSSGRVEGRLRTYKVSDIGLGFTRVEITLMEGAQ